MYAVNQQSGAARNADSGRGCARIAKAALLFTGL
jgi:hypothetical protein